MMNQCFIQQPMTIKIMQFVTDVCSECYRDFKEGQESFYDTKNCRYLCKECANKLCQEIIKEQKERYLTEDISYSQSTLF